MNKGNAYTTTKAVAEVYKVRSAKGSGWGWADITIREWKEGGAVDIQSDFGNWGYSWNAIGDGTFKGFLSTLNYSYFFGKAASGRGRGRSFDEEATIREIRRVILERRRHGDISRDEARDAWEEADSLSATSEDEMFRAIMDTETLFDVVHGGDVSSISTVESDDPQCRAFWDGPWAAVKRVWAEAS